MLRRGNRRNGVRGGRGRRSRVLGRKTHPASNPRMQFARSGCFVPSRVRTSLRFAHFEAIACSTAYTQRALSGNNAFDPGTSLSSSQPVGFDYWSAMYDRYRVIGSKMQLKISVAGPAAGNGAVTAQVTMWPGTQSASLSSQADAEAQPFAKTVTVTTATPAVLTATHKTSSILGLKNLEGADQAQALISAGPLNEWFWNIAHASQATYTNMGIAFEYIVTYDVEFFDRAMINRSSLVWKHIKSAFLERCAEHREQAREAKERKNKAELTQTQQLEHLKELDAGLKEIEDYKKRERSALSLVDEKEDNYSIHGKWVKLRELDELARETPKSRPPSKK